MGDWELDEMRMGGEFADSGVLFDRERRGYSARQVDEYLREIRTQESGHLSRIRQLEHELTLVMRQRDWECRVSRERENQVESLQSRVTQLGEEVSALERAAGSTSAPGMRIQKMLSLAEDEARSVVREAKRVADEVAAAASEESRELVRAAADQLAKANSKVEEAEAAGARLVGEAREEARRIAAEAAQVRDEVDSEVKFRREHMDVVLQSELERKRQQAETLIREQEDEALRAAEAIVAAARVESAAVVEKAQFFVENYRREFESIELSRNASVWQMVALRDSLEGLIRSCGRMRGVPELEPRAEHAVRV